VVGALTDRIATEAWEELQRVLDRGGSLEALAYMKGRLVANLARRLREIESGDRVVVGVNRYEDAGPSPLAEPMGEGVAAVERIEEAAEDEQIDRLERWRRERDGEAVRRALDALRRAATDDRTNLVPASIEAAAAGVTTGEWAGALREVFGEYRPPTGVTDRAPVSGEDPAPIRRARSEVADAAERLGVARIRMLVGKPGLDGHSNAAEQLAVRARDAGMEVVYQGIRLTPAEIARAAIDEDVHVIGLSILSGAHMLLITEVLRRLREEGVDPSRLPVVVGGIIPDEDAKALLDLGVARVFTPKDHDLTKAISEIAALLG
jgi:(2R)-ethylmalonyl-CoA mutase